MIFYLDLYTICTKETYPWIRSLSNHDDLGKTKQKIIICSLEKQQNCPSAVCNTFINHLPHNHYCHVFVKVASLKKHKQQSTHTVSCIQSFLLITLHSNRLIYICICSCLDFNMFINYHLHHKNATSEWNQM